MKKLITVLLALLFITQAAQAQLTLKNSKRLPEVKNGTTYVVMKDISSKRAKVFIEVFKKNWTYSKIDFINEGQMAEHFDASSSFLTITEESGGYSTKDRGYVEYTLRHFELWMCESGFLKKKEDKIENNQRDIITSYRVFYGFSGGKKPYKFVDLYQAQSENFGEAPYWTPGLVTNYLKQITAALEEGKDIPFGERITKADELAKLKTDTLYIPAWVAGGDNTSYVFGNYPYPYKSLEKEELSDMILNSDKPFYYITYKNGVGTRAINIVNGKTGEFIYTRFPIKMGWEFGPGEVKDLVKDLGK